MNYKITYRGKTAIFTGRDLHKLKERFARARTSGGNLCGNLVVSREKLCICRRYSSDCDKCPFSVWKDGCKTIINRLDPKKVVSFGANRLIWCTENQDEVDKVFRRVRRFLARAAEISDGDSDA